ncbi:MAG: hypothetical protein E5W21_07235, partial [Mesorhizobium sp.]
MASKFRIPDLCADSGARNPQPPPTTNYGNNFAVQQKTWIAAPKMLRCSKSCTRLPLGGSNSGRVFMLHVLYLVHDVSDPAVRRRITML